MTRPTSAIPQLHGLMALTSPELGDHASGSPVLRLVDCLDVPLKVAVAKIAGLVEKGYADYGVAVEYSWRTAEGDARLLELRGEMPPLHDGALHDHYFGVPFIPACPGCAALLNQALEDVATEPTTRRQ